MSNYAKIEDGRVINIIICNDSDISTQSGHHVKITDLTNRAQVGYEYIAEKNKFKSPQPFESWVLNEDTILWESPVQKPEDAEISEFGTVTNYRWDESSQEWSEI